MARSSSKFTNVVRKSTKRELQPTIVDALAERVRDLAIAKNLVAKALGERLGIPSSSAANYWSGKRAWPTEVLPLLAQQLDTNVEFLVTGRRESKTDRTKHRGEASDPSATVEVAELDLAYGMGGTYLDDLPVNAEQMQFNRGWLRNFTDSPPSELFFARGIGDSMMPTILDSDIVLIDRAQLTPRMADHIWAIAFGGVGMIKRLRPMPDGSVKIISDNVAVPDDRAVDEELHVIGRVVAVVRKI